VTAEVDRLEQQLRRALEGEAWHGPSVLELLADVTAEQAANLYHAGQIALLKQVLAAQAT